MMGFVGTNRHELVEGIRTQHKNCIKQLVKMQRTKFLSKPGQKELTTENTKFAQRTQSLTNLIEGHPEDRPTKFPSERFLLWISIENAFADEASNGNHAPKQA